MIDAEELLERNFPFAPTPGQKTLFHQLDIFINQKDQKSTFLLKGYAGTGKTTMVSALVKTLKNFHIKSILMAPTGRAAKVMSSYSKRKAFTIHKILFKQTEDPNSGRLFFKRQRNYSRNTVFIVDEASMIDNSSESYKKGGLLEELLAFIFEDPGAGNKLLLVGDTAQLPPVKQNISAALDFDALISDFLLCVNEFTLTEVVRQKEKSGILENATGIRDCIASNAQNIKLYTKAYHDTFRMTSQKMEDGLRYAYDKFGIENTCIICRSNKSATYYNKFIRNQLLFQEDEISAGDYLMVVRNNYFWLPLDAVAGFMANGEFVEVMKVKNFEEIHGARFADLTLRLLDYPNEPHFDAKIYLDTLHSFSPNLTFEESNQVYEKVLESYAEIGEEKEKMKAIRNDPYINALQVKFSYALTCHKSQGGQWDAVFVDLGYYKEGLLDLEFMRWIYTAITRSTSELFFVNFPNNFFS
ncbi:MAG: AAA family ATPase [Flammeovirgaceae bacterium]|nr:AAA family ATPase [Flammeovirgaceae bacterium]